MVLSQSDAVPIDSDNYLKYTVIGTILKYNFVRSVGLNALRYAVIAVRYVRCQLHQ